VHVRDLPVGHNCCVLWNTKSNRLY